MINFNLMNYTFNWLTKMMLNGKMSLDIHFSWCGKNQPIQQASSLQNRNLKKNACLHWKPTKWEKPHFHIFNIKPPFASATLGMLLGLMHIILPLEHPPQNTLIEQWVNRFQKQKNSPVKWVKHQPTYFFHVCKCWDQI